MNIIVNWDRWEQTTDNDVRAPEKALLEVINQGLDTRHPEEKFKRLWEYWWSKFPSACVLSTLTQGHFRGDSQELRFWFGEPSFFGSEHVDSNGENLIVTVIGGPNTLRSLAHEILPMEKFEKSIKEPADKDTITIPSKIIVWRRIKE